MASLERDRLGQARVDAEAELRRVLEGISGAQEKVLLVGHGLKEEVAGGTRKVFGECKSALETAIGRLLLFNGCGGKLYCRLLYRWRR